jgi:hypothetical protein
MLNKKISLSIIVASLILSTFTGCGEGKDRLSTNNETTKESSKLVEQVTKASVSRNIINKGESISFEIITGSKDTNIVKYEWRDASGKLLTNQSNFNRIFTKEGDYTTKLTMTDDSGKVTTSTVVVKVNEVVENSTINSVDDSSQDSQSSAEQVVDASSDINILHAETINLTYDGDYGLSGTIVSYEWRDLDGILISDTAELNRELYYYPQYDFNNDNTTRFVKTLTIVNDQGESASKSFTIIVHKSQLPVVENPDPVEPTPTPTTIIAKASTDFISAPQGTNITFNADGSSDGVLTYEWKLGDEVLSTNKTFSKNDFAVGVFNIILTVTNSDGKSATDTIEITIENIATANIKPIANAGADKSARINTLVAIKGTGTDSDGTIVSFRWTKDGVSIGTEAILKYIPRTAGTHTIELIVTDDKGAKSEPSVVTIAVTDGSVGADVTLPVIEIIGSSVVNLTLGSIYTDMGAKATDNKDGIITNNIITLNSVNTTIAGTYTVTYDVKDLAGNSAIQATRTVIVSQEANQSLIANASVDRSVEVGKSTTLMGSGVDSGGSALTYKWTKDASTLATTKTFDFTPDVVGVHTLTFTVTNSFGDSASDSVVVTATEAPVVNPGDDTILPVITMLGLATINLTVGDTYVDGGAMASDNKEGVISSNRIVTVNSVNTAVAGTYTVTYDVKDLAGNSAIQAVRTVIVSQDAAQQDIYSNWVVAKNDLLNDVSKEFGGNTVAVLVSPSSQIGEDELSITIDTVYGYINLVNTRALLEVNQNYANGTKMVVRVYDTSGNILGTSNELSYTVNRNLQFEPINF